MSPLPSRPGPLAGMKVIELAHIMAGPICGLMLADMGADVIKVEKPDGDDTRRFVPPDIDGESAAYMMMNRNKRGIALNLKDPGARDALKTLLMDADVVIENYRMGTMERLGLGYETLREINPRLVYCEVSGFGRTGPYAQRGGFDLIAQGMSGLMSITGEGPGRPPVKPGAPISDITAGILAAMGCCAAYAQAQASGVGQKVDTSLFEAGITLTYWQSAITFATGQAPGPMGSAHPLNAPYQSFRTRDGWINVGAANQRNWLRFLEVIGAPELDADPRFASNAQRMMHLDALVALLEAELTRETTRTWLERMEEAGLPAGPVLDIAQMHSDPQALARQMIVETEHPVAGRVKTIGLPVKFSDTPGAVQAPAPTLGQHSREILAAAGLDPEQIERMIASGAVLAP
ncbi:CaiB/BaiF CoA transferase family protein [Profundibacterium mesophilum]|uniref:L-carnitine dehydratase n=1 Tax=Profundibacterium mesophilum KAUST100406-0324 TaxID=1037889 RepID=A0A921NNY4_9RHOB|nr:CoA transferase [Profundibacterium mesophilum]KAF0674677.1 L-carnitine dehydratase [Profundibacterium mesophilum KAUST100406-0324]